MTVSTKKIMDAISVVNSQEITAEAMNMRWEMFIKISRGELSDNAILRYLIEFVTERENANFLLEDGAVGKYRDYKKMIAKKRRKERKNDKRILIGFKRTAG